jgi:hypothetical protein
MSSPSGRLCRRNPALHLHTILIEQLDARALLRDCEILSTLPCGLTIPPPIMSLPNRLPCLS